MSPRSPLDPPVEYSGFNSLHRSIAIVLTDDNTSSTDEEEEGEGPDGEFYEGSEGFTSDSSNSSFNEVGLVGPAHNRGLKLPSRGIAAQSLPNLLMAERQQRRGGGANGEGLYATSEDNLQSWYDRKPSLSGTISTADSKTSTLVGSIMVCWRGDQRDCCLLPSNWAIYFIPIKVHSNLFSYFEFCLQSLDSNLQAS